MRLPASLEGRAACQLLGPTLFCVLACRRHYAGLEPRATQFRTCIREDEMNMEHVRPLALGLNCLGLICSSGRDVDGSGASNGMRVLSTGTPVALATGAAAAVRLYVAPGRALAACRCVLLCPAERTGPAVRRS